MLTMDNLTIFAICYIAGTLVGLWIGFNTGVRKGADATIETLMIAKFLLFKRHPNGEVEFIKPENSSEIQQNQ